jgi:hypothetical protein
LSNAPNRRMPKTCSVVTFVSTPKFHSKAMCRPSIRRGSFGGCHRYVSRSIVIRMNRTTKLTLSIPFPTVKRARIYAKRQRTSISSLVTRLFESLDRRTSEKDRTEKGAILTQSSLGIISLPAASKADLLSDAINGKHSKR